MPIARTLTAPSIPPQLNQLRRNPWLTCALGLRQSTRTTTVWTPSASTARASNGR